MLQACTHSLGDAQVHVHTRTRTHAHVQAHAYDERAHKTIEHAVWWRGTSKSQRMVSSKAGMVSSSNEKFWLCSSSAS
jgi:hypothetical protein